jgi:hypothetical protein
MGNNRAGSWIGKRVVAYSQEAFGNMGVYVLIHDIDDVSVTVETFKEKVEPETLSGDVIMIPRGLIILKGKAGKDGG